MKNEIKYSYYDNCIINGDNVISFKDIEIENCSFKTEGACSLFGKKNEKCCDTLCPYKVKKIQSGELNYLTVTYKDKINNNNCITLSTALEMALDYKKQHEPYYLIINGYMFNIDGNSIRFADNLINMRILDLPYENIIKDMYYKKTKTNICIKRRECVQYFNNALIYSYYISENEPIYMITPKNADITIYLLEDEPIIDTCIEEWYK